MDYSKNFQHPLWQRKRLNILRRDNWSCTKCGSTNRTLNVTRSPYIEQLAPWDYNDDQLTSLCYKCREKIGHYEEESDWWDGHINYNSINWQRKRLEIFERDKYSCSNCNTNNRPLKIYCTKSYSKFKDPLEYSDEELTTFCKDCFEDKFRPPPVKMVSMQQYKDKIKELKEGLIKRFPEAAQITARIDELEIRFKEIKNTSGYNLNAFKAYERRCALILNRNELKGLNSEKDVGNEIEKLNLKIDELFEVSLIGEAHLKWTNLYSNTQREIINLNDERNIITKNGWKFEFPDEFYNINPMDRISCYSKFVTDAEGVRPEIHNMYIRSKELKKEIEELKLLENWKILYKDSVESLHLEWYDLQSKIDKSFKAFYE